MVKNRKELKEAMIEVGKIYTKYGLLWIEIEFINQQIKDATIEWYKDKYKKTLE